MIGFAMWDMGLVYTEVLALDNFIFAVVARRRNFYKICKTNFWMLLVVKSGVS